MRKAALLLGFAFLLIIIAVNSVSASYTFQLKDSWSYNEHITGSNRGFTITRTVDVPRNTCGYYDWSYQPTPCLGSSDLDNRVPESVVFQAFNTFQRDSSDMTNFRTLKMLVKDGGFRVSPNTYFRSYYY